MKFFTFVFLITVTSLSFTQSFRLEGTVAASELDKEIGQITIFSLPDSSLKKGSYIDSSYFSVVVPNQGESQYYAKFKLRGYVDSLIPFEVTDSVVHLGVINLQKDLNLETVEVFYREPMYKRTMDGIKIKVDGTTLETLDNLFEILKASPKLMSPDDESIEIIGKGSPLILIDRQPILTNDELKAIPANMIEKIEIITNPSAKYRAQGRGSGVIEVYTKDFRLQGYNMNINLNGGINTQLKPTARLGIGLSLKKKKFSLNAYLSGNYRSQNSFGTSDQSVLDSTNRTTNSSFDRDGWNTWQYVSIKAAYQINPSHKITAGISSNGSLNSSENISNTLYYENELLTTDKNLTSEAGSTWLNNSSFLNYIWETDTNKSSLEINLNYQLKINEGSATYRSLYEDIPNSLFSNFDIKNDSKNRPNIAELRVTYEHVFDTSGWKLSGGGSYNILFNGMKFDQFNWVDNQWEVDALFTNSYDYVEQTGSVFTEVTKNWAKVGVRIGVTGEYTSLSGYSNSLSKQFIDSTYFIPFPSGSIMIQPTEKVSMTLRYSSGISRPQFSNYDPFVRIQDSLSVQFGNPYLRPGIRQNVGLDFDLFYLYGFSVDYSHTSSPQSNLTFIDDSTFLLNSTPWNADQRQSLSVSLNLPLKTKWMSGWNSIWMNYSRFDFSPEFQRADFFNVTFGLWSYLSFFLPHDFTLTNRLSISKWGNENSTNNVRANWGLKLTKKMLKKTLRIFVEVSDIIPPKNKSNGFATNFQSSSVSQYQFTSFKLGVYYKFGRLKQETNIKESKSGQSGRI
jgi:Outer membrane protein beta-barrel family